jgi:hypothetical protein
MIHNARVKLLADLLNTMAGATIVAGVVAPIAAAIVAVPPEFRPGWAIFGIFLWTGIGAIFHAAGNEILGGLRHEQL